MAWEFAPYVRVNAIAPGAIWTEEAAKGLAMIKDQIEAVTPRRRVGTVEDIALAVLYLASPASDFVTGKLLEVDGGIEFSAPVATQGWGPNKTPKSKA
jgi:7-alpha-hydroxysteroid dehydrogenase